jgi:hypothetical protein
MKIHRHCKCGAPVFNKKAMLCLGCQREIMFENLARLHGKKVGVDPVQYERGAGNPFRRLT